MNSFSSIRLFLLCLCVQVDQDLEDYQDEFAELEDEDYSDLVEEQEETAELDEEKEELKEKAEETEEEINDGDYSSSSNGADDIYEDVADEAFEEEEEELEEEYYEEEAEWYWDEYPSSYDDELYDDAYWVRPKDLVQRLMKFRSRPFSFLSNSLIFILPFILFAL